MNVPIAPELTFEWAERSWQDPLTGTQVVCLSPDRKMHFRNNYFYNNLMTFDGRYAVFMGFEDIRDGIAAGARSLWARDMITGEVRDLGPIPAVPESLVAYFQYHGGCVVHFAAARYSHRVNVLDPSDPDAWAIIQVDIDTGERRRIVPSEPIRYPYFASFDASERFYYCPRKENYELMQTMTPNQFQDSKNEGPGHQEMLRVDLETGQVSVAHENVHRDGRRFNLEHSNPHPVLPNLFLSGARVIDFDTGEWLDHVDDGVSPRWHGQGYYHWALDGKRIYTKQLASPHVQCISRIDLETGQNRWFACPPHTGLSVHAHVAPNEQFVVGEGYDFDEHNFPPELRALLQQRLDEGVEPRWSAFFLTGLPVLSGTVPPTPISNSGETIWKYVLPEESVLDDEKYWRDYDQMYRSYHLDPEALDADLLREPDKTVTTTPICKYRTMMRSPKVLGYRLEANASVTPDSRWVVFQSSSEDDYFEVWAARVPE